MAQNANLIGFNTAPLSTHLREIKIAGSNLANENTFPTTIVDKLKVSKELAPLRTYYLTKTDAGIISLHQVVPLTRVGHAMTQNATARVQTTTTFIAFSCNKNEFDTTDRTAHVIKDSNLGIVETAFAHDCDFNALEFVGSPNEAYTPVNLKNWIRPIDPNNPESESVGSSYNKLVLATFFYIQDLINKLKDSEADIDSEVAEQQIEQQWNKYIKQRDQLIQIGYLIKNTVTYAESSFIQNASMCFQNTASQSSRFMNANSMYGNQGASYAPRCGFATGVGTVVDLDVAPAVGFQLGQFALASSKGEVNAVAENMKKETLESTTRAVSVADASGRRCIILLTVNDVKSGSNIIKRSDNLARLPVGSPICFRGELQIRSHGNSTLGVTYRVVESVWTTVSSLATSTVLATEDKIDVLDLSTNFGEALDTINFDSLASLNPTPLVSQEEENKQDSVALTDDDLQKQTDPEF